MSESNWVPVDGFPGYSVNPLGQVINDASGRLVKPRVNQYGVAYVGLMREWQQCIRSLSRLVARAFLPKPHSYQGVVLFDTPINLDGNPLNCRADNLMWRPHHYAVKYKRQFRDRYENPINKPIRAVEDDEVFPDSLAAATRYGLLEREVVLSILNNTVTWPTYQRFELQIE